MLEMMNTSKVMSAHYLLFYFRPFCQAAIVSNDPVWYYSVLPKSLSLTCDSA